ncbi:MAG: hypothetical protein U0Q16_37890 [Bryobacteraceae bacterium]
MLDSVALPFAASDFNWRKEAGETGITTRDPGEAWAAGREDGYVATALRAVRLAEARAGLLVHQVRGFQPLRRRYDLFAVDNDKLKPVWGDTERQGPSWSTLEILPSSTGDRIIYLNGYRGSGENPDFFWAFGLLWNEKSKSIDQKRDMELPALVAGTFPSAEAARRQAATSKCTSGYWALREGVLGGNPFTFALTMVFVKQEAVDAEKARVCEGKGPLKQVVFRPK